MANKQIDMRKVKQIFKLYCQGVSKRQISLRLGLSRNTIANYIAFSSVTSLRVTRSLQMTLEELDKLFKSDQKPKSEQVLTLEKYFPYLDLAKKVGNTRLDKACKRASDYGAYNYNIIERILKKGWDNLDEQIEQEIDMPSYDNIRGGHYYK